MQGLSYQSTVARELVHRAAVSEVFLTDWRHSGPDSFVCAVQWPQRHNFYSIGGVMIDPLMVVETLRQAGILIAHSGYGIPLEHSFLMQRLTWRCFPERMTLSDGPVELLARVEVGEIRYRARGVDAMRVAVEFVRDGVVCAHGAGWLRCVGPRVYARMRQAERSGEPGEPPYVAPADPQLVGREWSRDVVVGDLDETGTRPLRILTDHPTLFDHPLDHVPGMLAFEAMRQAAIALLGGALRAPLAGETRFTSLLELDEDCRVAATLSPSNGDQVGPGAHKVTAVLSQRGVTAVRGTVEMGPKIGVWVPA